MSPAKTIARLIALDAGAGPEDEEEAIFERTALVGELVGFLGDDALAITPNVDLEEVTEWLHRRTFLPGDTVETLLEEWRTSSIEREQLAKRGGRSP